MLTNIFTLSNLQAIYSNSDVIEDYSYIPNTNEYIIKQSRHNHVYISVSHDMVTVHGRGWNRYGDPKRSNRGMVWFSSHLSNGLSIAQYVQSHINTLLRTQQ